MTLDITKINSFWKRWWYQQTTYGKLIGLSFKAFFSHFPMGYINLLFQLLIMLVSIPIFIGNVLEFRVASSLIVKPAMEDIGTMTDDVGRRLASRAQVRAIENYKEATKTVLTFLLGVITTVITLYLTTHVFNSPTSH